MSKFTSCAAAALIAMSAAVANGQTTAAWPMERLGRGIVAVPAADGAGMFVSWRLLDTDDDLTTFDLFRDGTRVASNLDAKTNYVDKGGTSSSTYQVVTKHCGVAIDTTEAVAAWDKQYLRLALNKPADGINSVDETYSYTPNDCSVADVDGDGEYEIVLKWDPTNSKDNSQDGFTGNVLLDCYELDGTQLWRIDLGLNVRAGAHYTQFLVYDFDGDGKAELICRTAPGSIDSEGSYVTGVATDDEIKNTDNTAYYAKLSGSHSGHITKGPEFLTVFNGETGRAIHTVWYNPNHAGGMNGPGDHPSGSSFWGDNYGGRSERFLACVAYLDGPDKNPSAVMCRGYYTRAYLWAVDFDGKELSTKWMHESENKIRYHVYAADGTSVQKYNMKNTSGRSGGSSTAFGNGNHNLSVGDVDGDGCDEIIYGASAIDNDGYLMYATGLGHGDAMHLSDLVPDRPGLEVFTVHEEEPYGWNLHDAATGEILLSETGSGDNGRGLAADVSAENRGFEFWSASEYGTRNATTGKTLTSRRPSVNFRIYWDGDLQDELYDGEHNRETLEPTRTKIDKWNEDGSTSRLITLSDYDNSVDCNTTKHTPNLQADLIGDWREEVILWDKSDAAHLNIFTTNTPSNYRVTTPMHDHIYRLGIAWQNAAYNQPPHLGYYLPDSFGTRYAKITDGDFEQTVSLGDTIVDISRHWVNSGAPAVLKSIDPDGNTTPADVMDGFSFERETFGFKSFTLKGKPQKMGDYEIIIVSGKNVVDQSTRYDTIRIHCVDPTGIEAVEASDAAGNNVALASTVFTDRLTLNVGAGVDGAIDVAIYNAAGAQVYGGSYEAAGNSCIDIDGLGNLADGMYIVRVVTANGTTSTKAIKR